MLDLYTLLVGTVFGSFWLAILGILLIFFIILAIGSISSLSIIEFLAFFVFAMAVGYGYSIITVLLFCFAAYYMISQIRGWRERSGGN